MNQKSILNQRKHWKTLYAVSTPKFFKNADPETHNKEMNLSIEGTIPDNFNQKFNNVKSITFRNSNISYKNQQKIFDCINPTNIEEICFSSCQSKLFFSKLKDFLMGKANIKFMQLYLCRFENVSQQFIHFMDFAKCFKNTLTSIHMDIRHQFFVEDIQKNNLSTFFSNFSKLKHISIDFNHNTVQKPKSKKNSNELKIAPDDILKSIASQKCLKTIHFKFFINREKISTDLIKEIFENTKQTLRQISMRCLANSATQICIDSDLPLRDKFENMPNLQKVDLLFNGWSSTEFAKYTQHKNDQAKLVLQQNVHHYHESLEDFVKNVNLNVLSVNAILHVVSCVENYKRYDLLKIIVDKVLKIRSTDQSTNNNAFLAILFVIRNEKIVNWIIMHLNSEKLKNEFNLVFKTLYSIKKTYNNWKIFNHKNQLSVFLKLFCLAGFKLEDRHWRGSTYVQYIYFFMNDLHKEIVQRQVDVTIQKGIEIIKKTNENQFVIAPLFINQKKVYLSKNQVDNFHKDDADEPLKKKRKTNFPVIKDATKKMFAIFKHEVKVQRITDVLPDELMMHIFMFIDKPQSGGCFCEWLSVTMVCKEWNDLYVKMFKHHFKHEKIFFFGFSKFTTRILNQRQEMMIEENSNTE